MKKIILFTLIAISILIVLQHKLHATDITVGASAWYAWMNQYADGFPPEKSGSALLYGPVMAAKLNEDFDLTFAFLYGRYDDLDIIQNRRDKRDGDLALNYRLNDYLKLFAGIKYMGSVQALTDHNALGPGLGIGAAFNVSDNVFMLLTLSGLYLWGIEEFEDSIVKEEKNFNEYGINGTLSFAYYIADLSTVVSLGVRYQYYKTDFHGEAINYKTTCYGLTLTATYGFSM